MPVRVNKVSGEKDLCNYGKNTVLSIAWDWQILVQSFRFRYTKTETDESGIFLMSFHWFSVSVLESNGITDYDSASGITAGDSPESPERPNVHFSGSNVLLARSRAIHRHLFNTMSVDPPTFCKLSI